MQASARTEPADLKETDAFVRSAITDRTKKAQAPEPFIPKNQFGSARDMAQFKTNQDKTLTFLENTADLRDHASDSPRGCTGGWTACDPSSPPERADAQRSGTCAGSCVSTLHLTS